VSDDGWVKTHRSTVSLKPSAVSLKDWKICGASLQVNGF